MLPGRTKLATLDHCVVRTGHWGAGTELGEEEPYIVALQSELKGEKEDLVALANGLGELDEKMAKVQDELSSIFFVECALSRQLIKPRNISLLGQDMAQEILAPQRQ